MVRIKRSYRIQVCDTKIRPQWRAPLGSSTDRQTATRPDTKLCKKPALLFIVAPRAQASRRCETQAPLGGTPPKLCYRFGPLPPSARSANPIAGDGMKNGFPAPNKEPTTNQKHHLTGKAPYRFESAFLLRRVIQTDHPDRARLSADRSRRYCHRCQHDGARQGKHHRQPRARMKTKLAR